MPPSQLKTLKASLRAEGVLGPQQSKKQRKRNDGARRAKAFGDGLGLQSIRSRFNPFEYQMSTQKDGKFDISNNNSMSSQNTSKPKGRPGITKGLGEENRRNTLLLEMSRRGKVGGVLDRRFGENDPTMTPEERMLQRFTREQQRRSKNRSLFDLEGDEEEDDQLTHLGRSLSFDQTGIDDFDDGHESFSENSESYLGSEANPRKRKRSPISVSAQESGHDTANSLSRPKTKADIMSEVIAKSKAYKYERQKMKEDDEDLRNELDNEMPGLVALLSATRRQAINGTNDPRTTESMHPERASLLGKAATVNAMYDGNLKELIFDKRSRPTERSKTEEEKLKEAAERFEKSENDRLLRMHGTNNADDSQEPIGRNQDEDSPIEDDDALQFGFESRRDIGIEPESFGVEDEDEFVLDNDLIAFDSESMASVSGESEESLISQDSLERESLGPFSAQKPVDALAENQITALDLAAEGKSGLTFTYPCPETHSQLLELIQKIEGSEIFIVVQRIRSLYHPKLDTGNKQRLSAFAAVLVEHIGYLSNRPPPVDLNAIQGLIRHIHSMAKTFPEEIGNTFRSHLSDFGHKRPYDPQPADIILLIAIGSIFPTSDRFHPVITPALMTMTRYLAHKIPSTIQDMITGAFFVTLLLQFQNQSMRLIPETHNYAFNALSALSPLPIKGYNGSCFLRPSHSSLRLCLAEGVTKASFGLQDLFARGNSEQAIISQKLGLFHMFLDLIERMATQWQNLTARCELLMDAIEMLKQVSDKNSTAKFGSDLESKIFGLVDSLERQLYEAIKKRRPLELHHHRPLPIKTSIPKFEETYNPEKHYDPDRERSESNKLKAEYKKERKGALRELRKDANFVARQTLHEKRERDREYEKKFKRLVAEIQGEEGQEKNRYEREKKFRKGRK